MQRRTFIIGVIFSVLVGVGVTVAKQSPRDRRAIAEVFSIEPDDQARPRGKAKRRQNRRNRRNRNRNANRARPDRPDPEPSSRSSGVVRAIEPNGPRPEPPENAQNVVLVFGCTVRRDQVGVYGGVDGVTPWIDSLAAEGTRFDDALSVSSWTRASAVGVLTGRHPLALGMPEPGPRNSERVLPDAADTLAEHLAAAGWLTFGITANPNLNTNYGMAQGMDRYVDSSEKGFRRERMSGMDVVNQALDMLDERSEGERERPFYLQLMLIDAHTPRRASRSETQRFETPGITADMATYRATLHQLDGALDQLDRGLRSRGYDADDTLFVFVADHGEGLDSPPHHGPGHGKKMYPTTVQIPWILRGRDVPEGKVVEGLSSGADVLPTVLGLLGMKDGPGGAGENLAPWVTGAKDGVLPRKRAHAASMFHVANVASIWTREHQCQRWFDNDRDQQVDGCFDRQADPHFANPLPSTPKLEALRKDLGDWRSRQIKRGKRFEVTEADIDDEQASQLELLGYLEDDE